MAALDQAGKIHLMGSPLPREATGGALVVEEEEEGVRPRPGLCHDVLVLCPGPGGDLGRLQAESKESPDPCGDVHWAGCAGRGKTQGQKPVSPRQLGKGGLHICLQWVCRSLGPSHPYLMADSTLHQLGGVRKP